MTSRAFQTFEHAIQDAEDLMNHFDALNKNPPPPEAEVLKEPGKKGVRAQFSLILEEVGV